MRTNEIFLHLSEKSLVEIYATIRKHMREIQLQELDPIFLNRPDYVIWRLLRQRDPIFDESINDKIGVALLNEQIVKASSANSEIKWTCYSLIVHSLLMMALSYSDEWHTRSILTNKEEISRTDKINNGHAKSLLMWVEVQNKIFRNYLDSEVITNGSIDLISFRENTRKYYLSSDTIKPLEQHLLLGLGAIAVLAIRDKLGLNTVENFEEEFLFISNKFKIILSSWKPGYAIPIFWIHHKSKLYPSWVLGSCYLPFIGEDYNAWIASSFGFLSTYCLSYANRFSEDTLKKTWLLQAFMCNVSSIVHRDKIFSLAKIKDKKDKSYEDKLSKLLITIEAGIKTANLANLRNWEWGLAAYFLNISAKSKIKRLPYARIKSIKSYEKVARISGCQIPKEIEYMDCSESGEIHFKGDLEKTRDFAREQRFSIEKSPEKKIKQKIYEEATQQQIPIGSQDKINTVASILRKRDVNKKLQSSPEVVVIEAINTLLYGSDILCSELLEQENILFSLFKENGYVSGIAALLRRLRETKHLAYSALPNTKYVKIFASMLLNLLESPFMADITVRRQWQDELLHIYSSLTESDERNLRIIDLLFIFSAATHVSTVSVRGLSDEIGDQIERSIYQDHNNFEDSTSRNIRFWDLKKRSKLKILEKEVSEVLQRYKDRIGETILIQLLLVNQTTIKALIITASERRKLQYRVISVKFEPNSHLGQEFLTWHDLIKILPREDLFDEATGELFNVRYLSSAGNINITNLWKSVAKAVQELSIGKSLDHILLVPDPSLGIIPWQYIAHIQNSTNGILPSSVSLIPGVKWAYLVGHSSDRLERIPHSRGVKIWIANEPTPDEKCDIRKVVEEEYFRLLRKSSNYDRPSQGIIMPGVSLSVVLGHGHKQDESLLVDATAVKTMEEWDEVRKRRICTLLSCHTGYGEAEGLRDYVGVVSFLLRSSKSILAPSIQVPHTAILTLSEILGKAIQDYIFSDSAENLSVNDVYQRAIEKNPAVALFSLWGLAYEPIIWKGKIPKEL